MATKKKHIDESEKDFSFEKSFPDEPPVVEAKEVRPRPAPQIKRVSFHQYAVLKEIPERHRPGLKAFVKFPQKKRSIDEWDACLKNY